MFETKCRALLKLFSAALFSVFLAASICWAGPQISLPQGEEYNLGLLEEGKIYNGNFAIANTGDAPLEVRLMRVGCGCTTILYPKQKVEVTAGSAIEAKFTFNTEGMDEGENEKYIYIESDDPQKPVTKLKLIAHIKRSHLQATNRFLSFGLFTVLGAGLIDGINPCAFTVLIFFISFLNFIGYRKRELLILGSVFILSVFLTYILIGFGLFKALQSLEAFGAVAKIISLSIASLAIVLGLYSVYDWYRYRKTGNPDEIKLRLPNAIKLKIQRIVQNASRNKTRTLVDLACAVFISGFTVSILESVCTGQTYVPTITYVLKTPELRAKAFLYLVLYNVMFVLPLGIIFAAALRGVSSEMFSRMARKHLGAIKLLTAGLFFSLGILLFIVKG